MTFLLRPSLSSGIPIYVQLKEQFRHAVETGALRPGDPLPGMRALAEMLVVNPNTIARVYRELEDEGMLELRHGVGAFISDRAPFAKQTQVIESAVRLVDKLIVRLRGDGFTPDEIRRLVDAQLTSKRIPSRKAPQTVEIS